MRLSHSKVDRRLPVLWTVLTVVKVAALVVFLALVVALAGGVHP